MKDILELMLYSVKIMSENPENKKEPNDALAKLIWANLEKSDDREYITEERRNKQQIILNRLPLDFETQIKAYARLIEDNSDDDESEMAGMLFEELIRADPDICPEGESDISKLIRSILDQPDIYGLQALGIDRRLKNPDMIESNSDQKITGAIEIKSGQLGPKEIRQLTAFRKNITRLTELVRKLSPYSSRTLRAHGLSPLIDKIDKIGHLNTFTITLAIPNGVYNGDVSVLIKVDSFEIPEDLGVAISVIKKCKIVESPFSRNDLNVVTRSVMGWLKNGTTQYESGLPDKR